jgi:hypothetical protein
VPSLGNTKYADMRIHIPDEFMQVADTFYQGSYRPGMTAQEWIASRMGYYDGDIRLAARGFLGELLNGKYSDKQLQEVWSITSPDYCFSDKDLRIFLTMIRDMLE